MKALTAPEIRGNWATLMLPLNGDDSIDYERLAEEIDRLIAFEVDGIYSNGTAGEFFTQDEDEFRRVNELLAQMCARAGMPFQIGASHMSPQEMLRRVEIARDLAPSAVQVTLPDWFPVTNDEAACVLNRAGEQLRGIGMVLYNPPHAKRRLQAGDLMYLIDRVPMLVGAKVADGGEDWYREMAPVFARMSVFVPGHHLATGIKHGALGAYSNVACLSPTRAQRWTDMTRTDIDAALTIEREVRAFWGAHFEPYITKRHHPNFAVDKFAAVVGGWADIGTRVRFPYTAIDEADAAAIRACLKREMPTFWALAPNDNSNGE